MRVKFNDKLEDFDAILSFDLAKKKTGFSFYNYKKNEIIDLGIIDSGNSDEESLYLTLYYKFRKVLSETRNKGISFFVTKERLPNQNGPHSTIATLQELAKVHAIFDLAVLEEGVPAYDFIGVHSISVRAYFKQILNLEKPSKEDLSQFFQMTFQEVDFNKYSLDVTDSLGISFTLLNSKWDKDIEDEIKRLKKEQKKYKSDKKISEIDFEIQRLKELKKEN